MIEKENKSYIKEDILSYIKTVEKNREIIILAIGTDKIIGDCLGPLVGEFLLEENCKWKVYGNLRNPVDAKTLKNTLKIIEKNHSKPYIIAIDAAFGDFTNINSIVVKDEPIIPGLGLKKKLPQVGDLSIRGIVGSEAEVNYGLLNNLRLNEVYKMAKIISKAIIEAMEERENM